MPRTKKLKDLRATHGMVEDNSTQSVVNPSTEVTATQTSPKRQKTLNEILGIDGSSKYNFLKDPFSVSEYEEYVKNLTNSQLYNHCQSFGLMFTDNRKQVEKKLVQEFSLNRAKHNTSASQVVGVQDPKKVEVLRNIMSKLGK